MPRWIPNHPPIIPCIPITDRSHNSTLPSTSIDRSHMPVVFSIKQQGDSWLSFCRTYSGKVKCVVNKINWTEIAYLPVTGLPPHLKLEQLEQASHTLDNSRIRVLSDRVIVMPRLKGGMKKADESVSQDATPVKQAGRSTDQESLAKCLQRDGQKALELRLYQQAIEWFETSLAVGKAVYGENSLYRSTSFSNLGYIYDVLDQPRKSLECYLQGYNILKALDLENYPNLEKKQHTSYLAQALVNVGVCYSNLWKYEQACECYQQALEHYKQIYTNHPDVAVALNHLGTAYVGLKRYPEARDAYEQAREMWASEMEGVSGKDNSRAANLNNLGIIYGELKQYPQALEAYEQALEIFKKRDDKKLSLIIRILRNLSSIHETLGHHAEAQRCLQEVDKILAKIAKSEATAEAETERISNIMKSLLKR